MYAFVCLFIVCYFRWQDIGIDNATTNSNTEPLGQIREHSQSIQEGLGNIEQSTDSITRGIEQSQGTLAAAQYTVARIDSHLNEATRIIAECRKILQGVGEESSTSNLK